MRNTLLALVVLLCGGCGPGGSAPTPTAPAPAPGAPGATAPSTSAPGAAAPGAAAATQQAAVAGPPSWFSLGGEVYQENDREAEQELLEFVNQPRWFHGLAKSVSAEDFAAWKQSQQSAPDKQNLVSRGDPLPARLPYPKSLTDVPLEDEGATLHLDIGKGGDAEELSFTLALAAGDRAVRREVEHRWTNVLPFLFAFSADGKAVAAEPGGEPHLRGEQADRDWDVPARGQTFGASYLTVAANPDPFTYVKIGGVVTSVYLVPAHTTKTWVVRVATKSMDAIIPAGAKELNIVAAFSERQHEIYMANPFHELIEMWGRDDIGPQILIRSNVMRLQRSGTVWVAVKGP